VNAGRPKRIRVGALPVDAVGFDEALDVIDSLVAEKRGGTVFTPNVDHIVQAEDNPRMRAAYDQASLSLVDGVPVLWASRLLGEPLREKISGSDLVWPLLRRAAEKGHRVYFLGGSAGVAELARQRLQAELPSLQIVGIDPAYIDVEKHDDEQEQIVARVVAAAPDLVLVALGAPKQEIWSHHHCARLAPAVLLGVGASLNFVAGTQARSPRWMSKMGLEWLFRLAQEPRRLAGRYLLRDPRFCWILARQLWNQTHSEGKLKG
jgi:N-acetylglucosaminyldiphosphoundecaprenol N-acetyl-beta-D-mannosaminyltransferase